MSDFTMGATLTLTDNFSSTLTAAGHNAEAFKSQITGISSAMSSSTASMGRNSKRRERVRFRATECRFYRRQYG